MTAWQDRTIEERNLLNSAFCAVVIWSLARGYQTEELQSGTPPRGLPLELAFVGASFVLRGKTRESLPRVIRTSLPTWIQEHPLERSAVAKGVAVLRPYVREGLLLAARQNLVKLGKRGEIEPDANAVKSVTKYTKKATAEVQDCVAKALFVGRWLHKSGTPSTVMDLVGVRP